MEIPVRMEVPIRMGVPVRVEVPVWMEVPIRMEVPVRALASWKGWDPSQASVSRLEVEMEMGAKSAL